jgi:hypothetical protein
MASGQLPQQHQFHPSLTQRPPTTSTTSTAPSFSDHVNFADSKMAPQLGGSSAGEANAPQAVDFQSHFSEDLSSRGSRASSSMAEAPTATYDQTNHATGLIPARTGTLKKKKSLGRKSSLRRSGSRRSSYAGSVRSLRVDAHADEATSEEQSALYTPIPTTGAPTNILADRFQG